CVGIFIAVGTAMLWTRPARDWCAGRPITPRVAPRPEAPTPAPRQPAPPVDWAPPSPGAAQPPPTTGWGQAPLPPPSASDLVWPAPTGPAYGAGYGASYGAPQLAPPRPRQLRLACILTWVLSSVTALGYLMVVVALLVDRAGLIEELRKSPGWQDSFDGDTVATV